MGGRVKYKIMYPQDYHEPDKRVSRIIHLLTAWL